MSDPVKHVVVAGGAGFIGSHLCEALIAAGHKVTSVDNFFTGRIANVQPLLSHERFRSLEQDVCHPLKFAEKIDQIYNLACPASPPHYQADPIQTMLTCVVGTHNLLGLAEEHSASFVQASTSEVYGDAAEHPQKETYWGNVNCTGPRACYDEGKRAAEALCFDMLRLGRVDARVVRIFNTYGPRMRSDDGRIVSNLAVQAIRGEPLTIYGDGKQTRSFCFVSDLVEGLVRLMELPENPKRPVNLGNPGEFTVAQLADLVTSLVPTASERRYLPLPVDDPKRRNPDISLAKELLGWQPKVELYQGLSATVTDFKRTLGNFDA